MCEFIHCIRKNSCISEETSSAFFAVLEIKCRHLFTDK
ncbi:hypothetical protein NY08_3160 [Rhodococcus sp. B7740]|nr:hypothetical protein NY08_3160 [Rhodococcus sp. B7740]